MTKYQTSNTQKIYRTQKKRNLELCSYGYAFWSLLPLFIYLNSIKFISRFHNNSTTVEFLPKKADPTIQTTQSYKGTKSNTGKTKAKSFNQRTSNAISFWIFSLSFLCFLFSIAVSLATSLKYEQFYHSTTPISTMKPAANIYNGSYLLLVSVGYITCAKREQTAPQAT